MDASRAFANRSLANYSIYLLDTHPSAAAHQLFAETLYAELRTRGWFRADD